jgi:hypothetical protein
MVSITQARDHDASRKRAKRGYGLVALNAIPTEENTEQAGQEAA